MLKYLAAALLTALAMSTPAKADAINNLTIVTIPDPDVVPQSSSNPCIICATNQAHNPIGFGYNNFNSTGNTSSFNLFSSNITGAFGNGDDITVTPYSGGQLLTLLQAINPLNLIGGFSVAVDINTTGANSEHLDYFQLINLDAAPGSRIVFDLRDVDMPGVNNGNGAADYLIQGFDLSSIDIGDRLLFRAAWSGAVDGGESFYLVPNVAAVPGPIAGAGLPALLIACGGLVALARRRRKAAAVA